MVLYIINLTKLCYNGVFKKGLTHDVSKKSKFNDEAKSSPSSFVTFYIFFKSDFVAIKTPK